MSVRCVWLEVENVPFYSGKYSKQAYTQHQLLQCLVVKTIYRLKYRELAEMLQVSDTLRNCMGLKKAPHFTTFQKFAGRFPCRILHQLIATIAKHICSGTLNVAIDSTGFSLATSNDTGYLTVTASEPGLWRLTAFKDRYEPVEKTFLVYDAPIAVAVAAGTSLTLLFLLAGAYLLWRRHVKVFMTPTALRLLVQEDALGRYRRVHTLHSSSLRYPELADTGKLRSVTLNDGEREKASRLAEEYNIEEDFALSIVAAKKIGARELVVPQPPPMELLDELRPLKVKLVEEKL